MQPDRPALTALTDLDNVKLELVESPRAAAGPGMTVREAYDWLMRPVEPMEGTDA